MISMPGQSFSGPLPRPDAGEFEVAKRAERRIRALASEIGERNLGNYDALCAAARYLEKELRAMGYDVRSQEYLLQGRGVRNLEVELLGRSLPDEIVLVGAHYDSAPGTPGADDNASGVAALLELARAYRGKSFSRTLRLAFFTNEEPPFFWTEDMGSFVCARRCRERGERIVAMLSLETIGYFSEAEGSQSYPFPFSLFYPRRGDFLGFVGNLSSRSLVRQAIRVFRDAVSMPSEGVAAPGWIPGIYWSDQWSFWKMGYPGIMVTDTAPFRNPNYHLPGDTPEKIDFFRLARVVKGLAAVVEDLTEKKD